MSSIHGASAGVPTSVDAADAIRLVSGGEAWLLDVREDSEWDGGHASAAHHIPMAELGGRQDEIPAEATVLVMCHSGGRSRMVTDALVQADYAALNVEGGIVAWLAAGGDVVSETSDN